MAISVHVYLKKTFSSYKMTDMSVAYMYYIIAMQYIRQAKC